MEKETLLSLDEIIKLLKIQLGLKKIKADDKFYEDLGAESADIVNIIVLVEDKFEIIFPESEIPKIVSVRDLYSSVLAKLKH